MIGLAHQIGRGFIAAALAAAGVFGTAGAAAQPAAFPPSTAYAWTPEEFVGGGRTPDGLPAGSRKPVVLMVGDEDDAMQGIFVDLFQHALAAAAGDPEAALPLAAERAAPERANPQPIALSTYLRQTADRALVIVRGVDHNLLVDNFGRLFPWPEFGAGALPFGLSPAGRRKAVGDEVGDPNFSGAPYDRLDWAEAGDAGGVYLPHLIRDWYARAVFDHYLKGDGEARERLQGPDPFGELTSVRREVR